MPIKLKKRGLGLEIRTFEGESGNTYLVFRTVKGAFHVADPKICHGKPTFRGTRIMVWQVLEMVAKGMDWETIIEQCHNSITKEAIAEAVFLARVEPDKKKYARYYRALNEDSRLEKKWHQEDQRNLHRLIEIRGFLWT